MGVLLGGDCPHELDWLCFNWLGLGRLAVDPLRDFFQNFREFSEAFVSFSKFLDMLGPVRTHSDLFGCIRMHSDAFGSVWKRLEVFRDFWIFVKFLRSVADCRLVSVISLM